MSTILLYFYPAAMQFFVDHSRYPICRLPCTQSQWDEMKWILIFFSDLYPPDFLRGIYETFLVFEQHDVWWYRRCIEKQINATNEIHPIVLHLLHFDCKISFNYLVSDWSPITCSWHQKTNSPIHECEVMHKSKRPIKTPF